MITVFTPTYNRGYIIGKLYESLKNQTFRDFEWLVVDDGSTDDTEEIIKGFINDKNDFPIRYYKVENGGKHRAINRGVKIANGRLFFIVDSDDLLPSDSLKIVNEVLCDLPRDGCFAGMCGQKIFTTGKPIGTTFGGNFIDVSTLDRGKYNISGDKAEVFFTEILSHYPFPEFKDEKFCTESIVWDRIAKDGFLMRYFNMAIYSCEYLEDGLTKQGLDLYARNPRQWALSIRQDYLFGKTNWWYRSIQIYKYILLEKKFLGIKQISKYLSIGIIQILMTYFIHSGLDCIRKVLKRKTIKSSIQ